MGRYYLEKKKESKFVELKKNNMKIQNSGNFNKYLSSSSNLMLSLITIIDLIC